MEWTLPEWQGSVELHFEYGSTLQYPLERVMVQTFGWTQQPTAYQRFLDDAHTAEVVQGAVWSQFDGLCWPDEGYPCEVCWSLMRWPWEPLRACPIEIEPTYCDEHAEMIHEFQRG